MTDPIGGNDLAGSTRNTAWCSASWEEPDLDKRRRALHDIVSSTGGVEGGTIAGAIV
jgi:hypothetical protein